MTKITDYVSQQLIDEVDQKVAKGGFRLHCDEIQPENSEWVGAGHGRCVFEKNDDIVKVAHSREGISQNEYGYQNVLKHVHYNKDAFAMPKAVTKEVVIQEKAHTDVKSNLDEKDYAKIEGRLIEKVDRASRQDGILCGDVQSSPQNHGYIEGKGVVLTDLGQCRVKQPDSTPNSAERTTKRYEEGKPPKTKEDNPFL